MVRQDRRSLAAAIPVAVVAIVAAVISFSHIETLALAEHQTITAARTLPLAVDGLIVAGSVILLAGYALGWLCVVSGVAATLFANVESGVRYGPLAAAVAAWPAVAFTLASFVLERWLRRQARGVPAASVPAASVPAASVPAASVPAASVPAASAVPVLAEPDVPAASGVSLSAGGEFSPPDVQSVTAVALSAPDQNLSPGVPVPAEPGVPAASAVPVPAASAAASNGHSADAYQVLRECGPDAVPPIREIQRILHCGQVKAQRVQAEVREIRALVAAG